MVFSERKEKVVSEKGEPWMCVDPGKSVTKVLVKDNFVMVSKTSLSDKFGISIKSGFALETIGKFFIPKPHFNMNDKWKKICEENCVLTFFDLGFKLIDVKDFTFKEGMIGI